MPIYEYACRPCGHRFETLVRASAPQPECPHCRSTDLAKQLSVVGKVGGWARMDPVPMPGPCGTCGNPDGPGACALN